MQSARLILEVMRFVHHEDDHRARVSETKSSHASYFSREAVRRRAQDAALQITLGKLDESVRKSKLGNVEVRSCEGGRVECNAAGEMEGLGTKRYTCGRQRHRVRVGRNRTLSPPRSYPTGESARRGRGSPHSQ